MTQAYKIVASPIFKISLQRLVYFLAHKHSNKRAQLIKKNIRQKIEQDLIKNPKIAPISNRLIELGISQYRQYSLDEHNILFYQLDELNHTINLLAVIDSRQDIQKLLYEITLLA